MFGDAELRIGLLGPLQAIRDGVPVTLPRGRTAVLLAVLAMSAGHPVSAGRLAELIWADDMPERFRARVQTLVARLRAVVPGVIVTVGDGYLLDIDPDHVDLLRVRRLVRMAGETSDPAAARRLLEEALALRRGEPLADLRSEALDREVIPGLVDEQLSEVQQRAELDLAEGRYDHVIADLRGLTGRYPLREPLWDLLLRALAGAGRPAEAIGEYHRARETLAAELGVDPSPALQHLYGQLLQADRAAETSATTPAPVGAVASGDELAAGVPRQLPADTRVFTGRQLELTRLLDLGGAEGGAGGSGAAVISAIDGMAGIGKTALAVHAAHQLAGRFGDGQLFIDLHGYRQGFPPRTAGQALEALLRALGVPPQRIPEDEEERTSFYRERLAGTRTLIVLDNAIDEAQVRPLIPGEAGCLVLVTSRRKLRALDDAHTVPLDTLPEPDAIALFRTVAGPGRVAAGDPAVAEIAGLCGHLPLAMRIAASLLRNRPTWSPELLASRLRTAPTRLDALFDGDRDLAALFDLSSQTLQDDQRRLYSCLGLTPGPDADVYAAAALLDTDPATADRLVQGLVDHNVLLEPTVGRYRMHDLVRAHAQALAEDEPGSAASLGRLLDYYQHTALRADARMSRYAQPGPAGPAPAHAPQFPAAGAAHAWLRAERANLAACLQYAIQQAQDERTVALSAGLASLLRNDGPWPRAKAVHTAAAAVAERLGDQLSQARALIELGDLERLTGDYPAANRSLLAALRLYRETGDEPGQARALTELGTTGRLSGGYLDAERNLVAALRLYPQLDDKPGQARALAELGSVRYASGDHAQGERHLLEALALFRAVGNKTGQVRALSELADLRRLTGDYEVATRNVEAAVAISQELGDRLVQANALSVLGRIRCLTGDYPQAARYQRAAQELYQELDDPLGQANSRMFLAEIRRLAGDHEGVVQDLESSIAVYKHLGNRANEAYALNQYAAAVSATGDVTRATPLYRDALDLAREVHQPEDEAGALEGLGEIHLRDGRLEQAASYLRQAQEIYRRLGMPAAERVTARLASIDSRAHLAGNTQRRQ